MSRRIFPTSGAWLRNRQRGRLSGLSSERHAYLPLASGRPVLSARPFFFHSSAARGRSVQLGAGGGGAQFGARLEEFRWAAAPAAARSPAVRPASSAGRV